VSFGNPSEWPGDYYAPFYTVSFLSPNADQDLDDKGNVLKLTESRPTQTNTSDDAAKSFYFEDPKARRLRSYISSLIIEGVSSSAYKATVTLTPPYDVAVALLEDKVIKFGAVMQIQWGYRGEGGESIVSPVHLFRITQPSCQFGQTTTITITGRDLHTVTAESRRISRSWSRDKHNTDYQILREILSDLGNNYKLDVSALGNESSLLGPGDDKGYEQTESYARFFKRVCDRHNVGWIMKDKTLVMFDEDKIAMQPAAYRLRWRSPLWKNSDIPEIPVKEVTINPILTLFQGLPGTLGVIVNQPNLDKNVTPQAKYDDTNNQSRQAIGVSKRTAASGVVSGVATVNAAVASVIGSVNPGPALPDGASGDHVVASSREPGVSGASKSNITRVSRLTNTTAAVVIPGHPAVHPQMIVELVGLPSIFADRYLIRSVKHILGASYTCELELYSRVPHQDPAANDGQIAAGNTSQGLTGAPPGADKPPFDENRKPV
jgi:phage protein D